MYDPNQNKIIFSRDVKFNKSEHKERTEINDDPVHYIELDFTDETEPVSSPENCSTEQPNAEPVLRRSGGERKPPDFYGARVNVVSQSPEEPRSIKEAISSPEKLQWEKAMEAEMKSSKENEV